tara:strand:- start:168 stop:494 length:327 start_codon:yes stop_codon:yes gene_type:complete
MSMIKENSDLIIASNTPVHNDEMKSFIIKYIIKNPKTPEDCPALIEELGKAFPNISRESIAEQLPCQIDELYLQGIVSAYASTLYYVRDMTVDLIADCLRFNRIPEWD